MKENNTLSYKKFVKFKIIAISIFLIWLILGLSIIIFWKTMPTILKGLLTFIEVALTSAFSDFKKLFYSYDKYLEESNNLKNKLQ